MRTAIARLCFILPGLLLPGALLFLSTMLLPSARLWYWGAYTILQFLYLVVVEACRLDRHLSSSASYEVGEKTAERCAILVHGFADTPIAWQREADALAARGWRVIVPELSLSKTSSEWIAVLQETIAEAYRSARYVELWGHSMGGALCTAVAQRTPVDKLVLWAPFLEPYMGRFASQTLYWLHRILFLWPFTLTWFPVNRHGKGIPETFYRVRRVIPTRTFASALAVPKLITNAPLSCPVSILLSQRDTVVRDAPVRARFPKARFLLAENPRSSHALTNAVDWEINLNCLLDESK